MRDEENRLVFLRLRGPAENRREEREDEGAGSIHKIDFKPIGARA